MNSSHKGQWRGALVFSLICVWINGWVNNRDAGDLRRYSTHYDVIVMEMIARLLPPSENHRFPQWPCTCPNKQVIIFYNSCYDFLCNTCFHVYADTMCKYDAECISMFKIFHILYEMKYIKCLKWNWKLSNSFLSATEWAPCAMPPYKWTMLIRADSGNCPSTGNHAWWRHQMETFSALLAICAGNSPVTGEFPAQRPVTRSFGVFFYLRLNKRLSKQS